MKLLRNPWVTGGLCLGAAAVIYFQFSHGPQRVPPASRSETAPSIPAPKKSPLKPTQGSEPVDHEVAGVTFDRSYVKRHLAEWINSPRRDPFLLEISGWEKASQLQSPVVSWSLKGIWRQTGGRVAVINDHVYEEGDTIQGYKVDKIDGDQVWLYGPRGKERLGFEKPETEATQQGAETGKSSATPTTKAPSGARS